MAGPDAGSGGTQGESVFITEVRRVLSPLLARAGFAEVRTQSTFVEFEGHGVFVNLVHGRISCEIRVEMGVTPSHERRGVGLSDLIWALGGDRDRGWYGASSDDRVRIGVRSVAEAFEEYALSRLGTPDDVLLMEHQVAVWNSAHWRQQETKDIRGKAESAWRAKRFGEVIQRYRELKPADLRPVDRKRLALAERFLRDGDEEER